MRVLSPGESRAVAAAARYEELVEVASDAIYTLDNHGTLTSVNAALSELLGVDRDALVGQSLLPFVDPADQPLVEAHLAAAARGGRRPYECQFVRPDGARRLVSVAVGPVRV